MDDWSSFRTTTSEQQRLRAALSSFCESQDLPEEQRAAYTAYLRKRIRPAVEMLIREDDFSKLERILQTGWLSDADRKRFLNLAADQQKWQAFRILLNRSSQDPMQENTESRKTEAAFQKEKPTKEKEALALRLFEEGPAGMIRRKATTRPPSSIHMNTLCGSMASASGSVMCCSRKKTASRACTIRWYSRVESSLKCFVRTGYMAVCN